MTDRVIRIVLDSRGVVQGVRQAQGPLGKLDQRQKGLTSGFRAAAAAATAFAGALATREIIRLTNTYQSLQNQLRVVTDSQEQLNASSQRLFEIAQATRAPLESTVQLFSRASIAAEELGASEEDLFRLVEITGQALAVQGSSAAESSGALRQLSQAFSSGIVRAEEFNSILEGAFPLAQAAARGFDEAGGSVGRLRNLVIEGKVSSTEFFEAILAGGGKLDEQFAATEVTISQAVTTINNSLISFVGQLSEASGFGTGLAKVLIGVSDAIDDMGKAFTGSLQPQDEVSTGLQLFVTVALVAIQVVDALATSLITVLSTAFTVLGETIGASGAALAAFFSGDFDLAGTILDDLDARNLEAIVGSFGELQETLIGDTSATIEQIVELWSTGSRDIIEAATSGTDAAGGATTAGALVDPEDFAEAQEAVLAFIEALEQQEQVLFLQQTLGEDAAAAIQEYKDGLALASAEAEIFKDLAPTPEVEELREAFRTLGADAAQSIRDIAAEIEAAALSESFDDQIAALALEIELLGADNEMLAINAELRAIAAGATVEQAAQIRELTEQLLDQQDALRTQADIFTGFFEEVGANAQRLLSGILADPLGEGLDDLPRKFSQILLQLASDALASEIFKLLIGFGSNAPGGGSGGFLQFIGGLFGGGFQAGGAVTGGQPVLVGERGPEIFTPPGSGSITPNVNIQNQPAENNTTIINTIDESEITGAFQSGAGDNVLLNRISARRNAFKRALGV